MEDTDKKELRELALTLKQNPILTKLLALTYAKGLRDSQILSETFKGNKETA